MSDCEADSGYAGVGAGVEEGWGEEDAEEVSSEAAERQKSVSARGSRGASRGGGRALAIFHADQAAEASAVEGPLSSGSFHSGAGRIGVSSDAPIERARSAHEGSSSLEGGTVEA